MHTDIPRFSPIQHETRLPVQNEFMYYVQQQHLLNSTDWRPAGTKSPSPSLDRSMRPFSIVSVFSAGKAGTGNQLLVVFDDDPTSTTRLTEKQRTGIAREIGFAESIFISRAATTIDDDDDDDAKEGLRRFAHIHFGDGRATAFAGHPILGAAFALNERRGGGVEKVILELTDDTVVNVSAEDKDARLASSWQLAREVGSVTSEAIAATRNSCEKTTVAASEIKALLRRGADGFPDEQRVSIGGVGLDYALVRCKDDAAVDAIEMDPDMLGRFSCFFYFYAVTSTSKEEVHARMFCEENGGWTEDAATGSAAAALAAVARDIELPVTIHQGVLKGRPSILRADYIQRANSEPDAVLVAGSVRLTARGDWIDLGW